MLVIGVQLREDTEIDSITTSYIKVKTKHSRFVILPLASELEYQTVKELKYQTVRLVDFTQDLIEKLCLLKLVDFTIEFSENAQICLNLGSLKLLNQKELSQISNDQFILKDHIKSEDNNGFTTLIFLDSDCRATLRSEDYISFCQELKNNANLQHSLRRLSLNKEIGDQPLSHKTRALLSDKEFMTSRLEYKAAPYEPDQSKLTNALRPLARRTYSNINPGLHDKDIEDLLVTLYSTYEIDEKLTRLYPSAGGLHSVGVDLFNLKDRSYFSFSPDRKRLIERTLDQNHLEGLKRSIFKTWKGSKDVEHLLILKGDYSKLNQKYQGGELSNSLLEAGGIGLLIQILATQKDMRTCYVSNVFHSKLVEITDEPNSMFLLGILIGK
ncbi:MAG: hypothetical protein KC478_14120 [Bacteriovoracaceae bacterium]|nr:hypothetical protein [Bacteriovoracaceae bacterium]